MKRIARCWSLALVFAMLLSAGCSESRRSIELHPAPRELARADHVVIVVVDIVVMMMAVLVMLMGFHFTTKWTSLGQTTFGARYVSVGATFC